MMPWKTLGAARTIEGKALTLQERDGVFVIRVDGRELMSSSRHESEAMMAVVGLRGLATKAPHVLIGGLGLGYTLRAALDVLPSSASVIVAEISEPVVTWNRGPLAPLANAPLSDARVTVEVADVGRFASSARHRFDAILLDADNGPEALSRPGNAWLYEHAGLAALRRALKPKGRLVVWSAGPDARFADRLQQAGFLTREQRVGARRGARAHTLFIGEASNARSRS
jgi:spermidine synthase